MRQKPKRPRHGWVAVPTQHRTGPLNGRPTAPLFWRVGNVANCLIIAPTRRQSRACTQAALERCVIPRNARFKFVRVAIPRELHAAMDADESYVTRRRK